MDSSVALARLLAEDRVPRESLWSEALGSSRLLEYEIWTRVHARGLAQSHGDRVRNLLRHVRYIELTPQVLAYALDPFPIAVRTLDALHLATMVFLRNQGDIVTLASYDDRLVAAARALGIDIAEDML